MRKLVAILFIIPFFSLQAQNLQFIYEGNDLNDGDTIFVEGSDTVWEVISYLSVKNKSGNFIITNAKREFISSTVEGSANAFCWGVCYTPGIDVGTRTVTMAANEINTEFSGHHYNNNYVSGISKIKYTVFNTHNENDNASVVVVYNIGDNATTSSFINRKYDVFDVFPNPVQNILHITRENNIKVNSINIYDLSGRKILEANNSGSINLSAVKSGIYFVKINENSITRMIIKQ